VSDTEVSRRLEAFLEALKTGRPKPQVWYAFILPTKRPVAAYATLVASLLMGQQGTPDAIAAQLGERFDAISDAAGRGHEQGLWVDAALALSFAFDRDAFGDAFRSNTLTRQEATAIAILCEGQAVTADQVRAMSKAISPWIVNQVHGLGARLSVYAIAHVASGRSVEAVLAAQDQARAIFQSDPDAKKAADAGARACAAFGTDPQQTLQRYKALRRAQASADRPIRKIRRDMMMEWAAEGLDTDGFAHVRRLIAATSSVKSMKSQLGLRFAWLIHRVSIDGTQTGLELTPARRLGVVSGALAAAVALASSGDGGGGGFDGGDGGGGD
jgi:hypothetical protein